MHCYSLRNTAPQCYHFYNKPQLPVTPLETNPVVMADQNQPGQQDNAPSVQQNQANAPVANPTVNNHPDEGVAPDGPLPGPPPVIASTDETLPVPTTQALSFLPTGMLPFRLIPFSGSQNEDAAEFLTDFCEYAKVYSLSNTQSKHLFMMSLRDGAKQWIRQKFQADFDTTPCEQMLDAFKDKFYPKGVNWPVELEFEALKQLPGQFNNMLPKLRK